MTNVLSWDADRPHVLRLIEETQSLLKIVLKTKNDRHFLSKWIEHYSEIVGLKNIIIFDNDSNHAEIFRTYDTYPGLLVVRFLGLYDDIHAPAIFSELYRALKESSRLYAFFDTDEFLVGIEDAKIISPLAHMTKMADTALCDFVPSVWLPNKLLQKNIFPLGTDLAILSHGLAWGKPILLAKSRMPFLGRWNHNCEISQAGGRPSYEGGLFLLHMSSLFPQQRMAANREKLISRGFADQGCSIQDIIDRDLSNASPRERFYANEIRYFSKQKTLTIEDTCLQAPGDIEIMEDGSISGSTETLGMMAEFISQFRQLATNILVPDCP